MRSLRCAKNKPITMTTHTKAQTTVDDSRKHRNVRTPNGHIEKTTRSADPSRPLSSEATLLGFTVAQCNAVFAASTASAMHTAQAVLMRQLANG
jgi:hypothetical protein